jgi:hypothetical protein
MLTGGWTHIDNKKDAHIRCVLVSVNVCLLRLRLTYLLIIIWMQKING